VLFVAVRCRNTFLLLSDANFPLKLASLKKYMLPSIACCLL
jgi:hypothetical protein